MKSQLLIGSVYHKRLLPKKHDFKYGTYFIKIALSELRQINIPLFSYNRFNLFSFNDKDHGHRNGDDQLKYAQEILTIHGQPTELDDIIIHTMPRILGFVFNPVSFWYIYKKNKIIFILAEVNNTFGEHHSYLLHPQHLQCDKQMQVSPFNQVIGNYNFRFVSEPHRENIAITYSIKGNDIIYASVSGASVPWTNRNFLLLFLKNPIQNLLTVYLIHFQALSLFLKRIPFYGKKGEVL